jgi:RNA polymerase sigma-70 factor (ECF subfamily)
MEDRFRRLADAYKNTIYTFALYSLRRQEDAEDVTQDVLVKLWQNMDSIDPERAGAWVMRVARNAVIDVARRRKTRSAVFAEEVDVDIAANYAVAESGTDRHVRRREFREALESALAGIDEPYRSILIMREVQQHSYREIVEALDMPLNTVKVYLHRGRRMLREALGEEYREA